MNKKDETVERFAEMAKRYQAEKAKGVPAHLIMPTPTQSDITGQRGVGVVHPDVGEAVTDPLTPY